MSVCIWVMEVLIVTFIENGHNNPSSDLEETVCISHNADTFGKGVNSIILLPAMNKL